MDSDELTDDDITIIITALEYFQRDLEAGDELTAGGLPVSSSEVDAIIAKLEALPHS